MSWSAAVKEPQSLLIAQCGLHVQGVGWVERELMIDQWRASDERHI